MYMAIMAFWLTATQLEGYIALFLAFTGLIVFFLLMTSLWREYGMVAEQKLPLISPTTAQNMRIQIVVSWTSFILIILALASGLISYTTFEALGCLVDYSAKVSRHLSKDLPATSKRCFSIVWRDHVDAHKQRGGALRPS